VITTPAQRDLAALSRTLVATGDDARVRRLTRNEAVWKGLLYELEARPSFWSTDVPLAERAPCVVYPIARSAGQRVIALVFGEGRFPRATAPGADDALAAIVTAARLRLRMREVMEQGLSTSSACVLCAIRDGRLCVELLPSKWVTPTLDVHGAVQALDVRFRYPENGRWYWYRRTITPEADTVYAPCEVTDAPPVWVEATSVPQPGFVPAVWVRNEPDATQPGVDGCAFAEGLEDELEALDFALSMRHRTARYNGDPLTVRVMGASDAEDDLQAERGREQDPRAGTFTGWAAGVAGSIASALRPAIKKAPGRIVTVSNGGDMKLVESSGSGAAMLGADADDLRRKILETLGVVMADPETVSANASAALQKALYAPMLARCDGYRETYGEVLRDLLRIFVRLLRSPGVRDSLVHVDGWPAMLGALDALGTDPTITLTWGEYFDPTPADVAAGVQAMTQASGGQAVVSRRAAVGYLATLLGTKDVDGELAAITQDEAGGHAATTEMLGALSPRDEAQPAETTAEAQPVAADPEIAAEAKDPQAALNGAQVSSLLEIVSQVAAGAIPRATGVQILTAAFPLDEAAADKILGTVGAGFVPAAPAP